VAIAGITEESATAGAPSNLSFEQIAALDGDGRRRSGRRST
jgi:hypothetical protein